MYIYIYCLYVVNLYRGTSFSGTMWVSINLSSIEGWTSDRLKTKSCRYKLDCQAETCYLAQMSHHSSTFFFAHTLLLGKKQVYSLVLFLLLGTLISIIRNNQLFQWFSCYIKKFWLKKFPLPWQWHHVLQPLIVQILRFCLLILY